MACSSTRPKGARSTARRTCIRTSAAATTLSRSASRRRCRRRTRCSPALRRRAWPRRRPTPSWRSASHRSRGTRTCSSGRSASSARWCARTTFELNYIGTHGSNLLMRQNIAQAFLFDPAQPAVGGRAEAVSRTSASTSTATGAAVRTTTRSTPSSSIEAASSILTFAYTWAKSTDSKSAAAGIGASGFNGWQGFLDNHDPERDYGLSDFDVDHRLVGSFVYNLPFGNGEKVASDATGAEERGGRRLAGERHLHLAARVPDHDHRRRSRRAQRHLRHQPRQSGGRSEHWQSRA